MLSGTATTERRSPGAGTLWPREGLGNSVPPLCAAQDAEYYYVSVDLRPGGIPKPSGEGFCMDRVAGTLWPLSPGRLARGQRLSWRRVAGVAGVVQQELLCNLVLIEAAVPLGTVLGHTVYRVLRLRVLPCGSFRGSTSEDLAVVGELGRLLGLALRFQGPALYYSPTWDLTQTLQAHAQHPVGPDAGPDSRPGQQRFVGT